LAAGLQNIPDASKIKQHGKQVSASINAALIRAHSRPQNTDLEGMSYEDRRALVEAVFGGTAMDGSRLGVYIESIDGEEKRRRKKYRFTIRGHFIEQEGIFPLTNRVKKSIKESFGSPHLQRRLTKSASY
jgi:hypothetical protein